MKNAEIIAKLNLEQKCALLSGAGTFTTRGCPKAGVPSITLSDGPNGVRKQAGAADHLGLNPSVPATCFPTAATVACSWDPALGEEIGRAMGERLPRRRLPCCSAPDLTPSAAPCADATLSIFPRTRISRARWPPPMCGASKRGHCSLPQAFCRQQSGAAAHGVRLRSGRAHAARAVPDRL